MIAPAFGTRGQALAFASVLALMLAAPFLLTVAGAPSRAALYAALPTEAGPVGLIHRQLFVENGDVDMVFVGASYVFAGVDTPHVQRAMSRALGRDAVVLSLAMNFRGEDLSYLLVRDLLQRRRVRTVVVSMPLPREHESAPHPFADRVLTVDDPRVMSGLPLRHRVQVYAVNVLGAPRRALSLLREDRVDDVRHTATLGAGLFERGWDNTPFRPTMLEPPTLPPRALIFSPETAGRFDFVERPLTAYQAHFLRALAALLRERGVRLIVLNVPVWMGGEPPVRVEERLYWPDALGMPLTMIGVPPAELFAGLDRAGIETFHYNTHMNRNGAERFTRVVTPALIEAVLHPDTTVAPLRRPTAAR